MDIRDIQIHFRKYPIRFHPEARLGCRFYGRWIAADPAVPKQPAGAWNFAKKKKKTPCLPN